MTTIAALRHPDCKTPNQCRIEVFGCTATLLAWTPVYDGDGKMLNADPNTSRDSCECLHCGMKWQRITKNGETTYVKI